MRRYRIAGPHLLDGDLALDTVLHAPDKALVQRKQPRYLRARPFGRITRKHLSAIGQRQQREARLRFPREYRGDDRRRRQGIRIGLMVAYEPRDTILDKFAGQQHGKRTAGDFRRGKKLWRRVPDNLYRCKPGQ